jgi:hypothetical protein
MRKVSKTPDTSPGEWTENDWNEMMREARQDGGMIVSKTAPPSGCECDHRESVWEYHKKTIRKVAEKQRFKIVEHKTQVHLIPLP